jgi:hypothetical protein
MGAGQLPWPDVSAHRGAVGAAMVAAILDVERKRIYYPQ